VAQSTERCLLAKQAFHTIVTVVSLSHASLTLPSLPFANDPCHHCQVKNGKNGKHHFEHLGNMV